MTPQAFLFPSTPRFLPQLIHGLCQPQLQVHLSIFLQIADIKHYVALSSLQPALDLWKNIDEPSLDSLLSSREGRGSLLKLQGSNAIAVADFMDLVFMLSLSFCLVITDVLPVDLEQPTIGFDKTQEIYPSPTQIVWKPWCPPNITYTHRQA
jgi:hypothetical protein